MKMFVYQSVETKELFAGMKKDHLFKSRIALFLSKIVQYFIEQ